MVTGWTASGVFHRPWPKRFVAAAPLPETAEGAKGAGAASRRAPRLGGRQVIGPADGGIGRTGGMQRRRGTVGEHHRSPGLMKGLHQRPRRFGRDHGRPVVATGLRRRRRPISVGGQHTFRAGGGYEQGREPIRQGLRGCARVGPDQDGRGDQVFDFLDLGHGLQVIRRGSRREDVALVPVMVGRTGPQRGHGGLVGRWSTRNGGYFRFSIASASWWGARSDVLRESMAYSCTVAI